MREVLFFLSLLLLMPAMSQTQTSTKQWSESMAVELDSLLRDSLFQVSDVALMVYDLDIDSVLYRHNERKTMRPASTMKLLTAITALDMIGPKMSFDTRIYVKGEVTDSVLIGDIYCKGGFDPSFDIDDMHQAVQAITALGIDSISGSIFSDMTMKDTIPYGEGWSWDDSNPKLVPLIYERKPFFAESLAEALTNVGVRLNESFEYATVPDSVTEVFVCSKNVDQILLPMMKDSNNLFAEAMFYKIAEAAGTAPVSARDARKAEEELINRIGFDHTCYRLADGSGLSLYNYLSAELEIQLLKYAYRNNMIRGHLLPALPEAGYDGTLKKRMKKTPAEGKVLAKTGTLTGVITLAGYATAANGHQLCFAIFNQGVLKASLARAFQDKVCIAICR